MPARRTAILFVLSCGLLAVSHPAMAQQTPVEQAEALNARGKVLYTDQQDYRAAAEKFRAAIALSPDARYFYNLCAALEKLGQYREALDACDEVFNHAPRQDLATKTGQRAAQIRKEYRAAREAAQPPPTSQPAEATTPPEPAAAEPPAPEPENDYRVAIGADLGLVGNLSVGVREYAPAGLAVRIGADDLILPRHNLAVGAYFHMSLFGDRADVATSHPLSIYDLGIAAAWHRRLWRSLYLTPAAGLHFTVLSTSTLDGRDSYATMGIRLEAALEWVFPGGRHVITFSPVSVSIYLPAFGQIAGAAVDASEYGFNESGSTWAVIVGYRLRFQSGPFPVLE